MLRSFPLIAREPGSPLKREAANARDTVLLASLAVACAEGWRATSDKGHHAVLMKQGLGGGAGA